MSGMQAFSRFLALNGHRWNTADLPPISEDILIYFVGHCVHVLKMQFSTIKMYLCGVRYNYVLAQGYNPLETKHGNLLPRLAMFMNGVKKCLKTNPRARLPITYDILSTMIRWLNNSTDKSVHFKLLYKAVFSVAFYGFLRCGECTVNKQFDSHTNLCVEDVMFSSPSKSVTIHLKASKTDPARKGVDIVLFANDLPECPYDNMRDYMSLRNKTTCNQKAPLFVDERYLPLTRNQFIASLKEILSAVGLDNVLYSGHSFRIGAATAAASAHVEDHLIKTLGRWSSDCYQTYIRTPTSSIRDAQRAMSNSAGTRVQFLK